MSRRSDMTAATARNGLGRAVEDAIVTGLLTFFLLLPLIGFKTVQNIHNELALETRWTMLFVFVAIAVAGRLVYGLVVVPWRERRAARARQADTAPSRLRAALASLIAPATIGFVIISPPLALALAGFGGGAKWIDNFGI